ncbi:hypothetical protein [Nocardia pneumoniae]|uniref:hypothetical protein n=1 Tax=Nocardia pneumoniae TaxID=228601 RepID=UPI001FE06E59|nr:hypothetical protein [Nocardia pneumoniae]
MNYSGVLKKWLPQKTFMNTAGKNSTGTIRFPHVTSEPPEFTVDHPLSHALAAHAPAGWRRIDAVFAMTVSAEVGDVVYSVGGRVFSAHPSEAAFAAARDARAAAGRSRSGAWWRILVVMDVSGAMQVDLDHGSEPFPARYLFPPEAYRADLSVYPRERLPVWLGAYIAHGDRQRRRPRQAARQAYLDRSNRAWARLAENEFPPFPALWARWATIAAAFVAAGSERGPRMLPWTGVFEGTAHDGSTLHVLPGGRAVLSGGVWNASTLDATYNDGAPMPDLYVGAPDWVAEPALNPRVEVGLLSFCYWWDAGHWYRGQSPSAAECAPAVPGMWTRETTTGLVQDLAPDGRAEAIATLVAAAEEGGVTRAHLHHVFGAEERFDIDGAFHQYMLAGLVGPTYEPITAEEAIARVRDYIAGLGLDTTGYPTSQLAAQRFSVGWAVSVPVPEGKIALGRATFYIGDDGVLEYSSAAPETCIARVEQRIVNL